jgi:hypothetical protein
MPQWMVSLALAAFAQAQEEPPPRPIAVEDRHRILNNWNLQAIPERALYQPYLSDPRQSRSGSKVQFPLRSKKDSNIKIENTLGGFRTLALWTDPTDPEHEMDLSLEAAVFSRFDIQEGWDMDAADYRFGFPFVFREGDLRLKVHLWHLTSHLGDEFISRENAERDSYHVNELSFGASWQIDPEFRVYSELGAALYTGPATSSGRAQVGAEWVERAEPGQLAPFVAGDFQTRNEIGWNWNVSVMGGFMIIRKDGGHGLRGFLEWYRGHDQQTQFKSQLEHYLAVGVSADF